MRRLYSNGFLHHSNAVAINLGNNALQDIRAGAFHGLGTLRRLYLHENKLEVFRNDTFSGLEALEYLQVGLTSLLPIRTINKHCGQSSSIIPGISPHPYLL